jgi:translocator protein
MRGLAAGEAPQRQLRKLVTGMSVRSFVLLLIAVLPVAATLAAGGWVTARNISPWYQGLDKPGFTPPGWLFGPVWTVLYLLMAFAIWRVLRLPDATPGRTAALALLAAQLLLNAAWPWMFFGRRSPSAGLINIVPQWLLVIASILAVWQVDPLAALSLVPLAAWVGFAVILNWRVWRLNG